MPFSLKYQTFTLCAFHEQTEKWLVPKYDELHHQYIVWGEEVGEDGYWHYQGYVEWKCKALTDKQKQNIIGGPAHFEVRRGTQDEAISYATKDLKHVKRYGTPVVQGQRTDIKEFFEKAEKTDNLKKLVRENPSIYARTHNALDKFLSMPEKVEDKFRSEKRDIKPQCIVVYGKPGTGKSHFCRQIANGNQNGDYIENENLVYEYNPTLLTPEQYKGQGTVLIQEFGKGAIPAATFCLWIDKGRCLMNVKYKSSWLCATRFIINTNFNPTMWYSECPKEVRNGVMRRVTERHLMTHQYEDGEGSLPPVNLH